MPNMIPEEVDVFQTDGEERFYNFLRQVAKPEGRFLGWYLPDVEGREPDFILYGQDVGLIIFEVKDWSADQIREANPKYFELNIGGKIEKRTNPFFQARGYFTLLLEKLTKDGRLTSQAPEHLGKSRVPVSFGVVFPNINKYDYEQMDLGDVVPVERTLFWDDLHGSSDICMDSSGRKFQETLKTMFPPPFPFRLTGKDMDILRNVIFPVIRIEQPNRPPKTGVVQEQERLCQLDHNQEAIARRLSQGHRIVTGPSGSGKTMVLAHRAELLLRYTKDVKRILFVCYNLTLANHIRRILASKRIPLGETGVEVCHFFQLCSKVVGESVPNQGQDQDYYELVIQEALENVQDCGIRYDAVLIDEGQDFSNEMLQIVVGLLEPSSKHLTIAMDKGQRIYKRRASWRELGIEAKGRVHRLDWVYRNTDEIAEFAAGFMGKALLYKPEKSQHELLPNLSGHHGPVPIMNGYKDFSALRTGVVQTVEKWLDQGYPASEIGILYTFNRPRNHPGVNVPVQLKDALEAKGILSQWVSENAQSKNAYDVTTNRVTISTVHSVKGLDFSCVILIGVDHLDIPLLGKEHARNLVYVAITRARTELVVAWTEKTNLIERLEGASGEAS